MNLKIFIQLLCESQIDSYFIKYQIGDDSNNLIELKNTRFISGVGDQHLVFAYLDYVIKILRTGVGKQELANESNLKSLSKKKTQRILMPEELVYDTKRRECCGHTMTFIGNKKSIIDELVDHFLDEVSLIWQDADYLTNEFVLLDDLHKGNIIYNGHINIIDCGKFKDIHICSDAEIFDCLDILKGSRYEDILENQYNEILNQIRIKNNERINKLILTVLLREYVYEHSEQMEEYIKHLMEETKITNVDEFIESTKEPDMTVNEYVQRFAKRLNMGI